MRCPKCGHTEARVTDSRDAGGAIRRRRECLNCGERFTTYERIEVPSLWVVKRDGRRERFSREKLTGGLQKASAKRPVPIDALNKLVDEVEAVLHAMGRPEVSSAHIGDLVMERLQRVDHVAYVRYASVYRKFEDVDGFRRVIDSLMATSNNREAASQLALLPESGPVVPVQMPGPRRRGRPPSSGVLPRRMRRPVAPTNGASPQAADGAAPP